MFDDLRERRQVGTYEYVIGPDLYSGGYNFKT
jgi:hypothetical protein